MNRVELENITSLDEFIERIFLEWGKEYKKKYNGEQELSPIEQYAKGVMSNVNEYLRGSSLKEGEIEEYKKFDEKLAKDFESVPVLNEKIMVYRLVNQDEFNKINNEEFFLVNWYLSTTLDPTLVNETNPVFHYTGNQFLLIISVPPEMKCACPAVFEENQPNEYELLFNKGVILKKVSEPYIRNDKTILDCELMSKEQYKKIYCNN